MQNPERSSKFIFQGKTTEEYLDLLKQRNPDYDYYGVSADMLPKAIEFALSRKLDPSGLSPAQIILSQDFDINEKTLGEIAEEQKEKRTKNLLNNKNELAKIFINKEPIFSHATPTIENAQSILDKGLYCDRSTGLNGVAVWVSTMPSDTTEEMANEIIEKSLKKLADSHRNYRYQIIIALPNHNRDQKTGQQKIKQTNIIKPLTEEVGVRGVEKTYNSILSKEYIKGYIDLETGKFFPNS